MNIITLVIFAAVMVLTLGITAWAARRTRTASDFYTAGHVFTARQNGFALAGDLCSAAAFLGFTGLTALYGLDGALYAVGPLVAFCTILLLVAEPLRNTGKYTLGDVIRYRMRRPPALTATVIGTIVINLAYLVPQMAGGGVLLKLLLGLPYDISVILVGVAMIIYVSFGGMLATSWVQIVKAVLMLAAAVLVLILALNQFGFDPFAVFDAAEEKYGPKILLPGNYLANPLDQISLGLGYMLGLAGLPHLMTRFYTVPDATTARKSVIWVMFLAGAFFACTTLFGYAAANLVGQDAIRAADKGGNLALPLLAEYLGGGKDTFGGEIMLGLVAAAAVATILAVVSALTLATSGTIAHDLYVNLLKGGKVDERQQVLVARIAAVAVGIVSIILSIYAQGVNVAVLVILAICIAASANFPVLILSLFWRRFNTGGVIGGITLGLISSVGFAVIGPAFMGKEAALFPLVNPTVVALPLGFLGAVLGTLLTSRNMDHERHFDEVTVRIHLGVVTETK